MASVKYLIQSQKEKATIYLRFSYASGKVWKRKTNEVINPKYKKGEPKNIGKTLLSDTERQEIGKAKNTLNELKAYI